MDRQSFSIDFKGAYTLEEHHMLSFERLIAEFCGKQPGVNIEYENSHQVGFADMASLLDSPFTRGRAIKHISVRGQGDDPYKNASLTIRRSFCSGSFSADIASRDASVVQLESLIQSEAKSARRFYWPIRQFSFPLFMVIYVAVWIGSGILGFYKGTANPDAVSAVLGFITASIFTAIIVVFFPRVEFNFGRGKKAVHARSTMRKFVGSGIVVGYGLYLLFENLGNPFA